MDHKNEIAIKILRDEYADYDVNSWHYDRAYKMLVEAQNLALAKESDARTGNDKCHIQNVNRRVSGFVAMNKGEYDIENMSFYTTKKKAEREWGSKQDIVKVQVNFQHGG